MKRVLIFFLSFIPLDILKAALRAKPEVMGFGCVLESDIEAMMASHTYHQDTMAAFGSIIPGPPN